MTTIFIANTTARNHHLNWRLPEASRVFDRMIRAGGQEEFPGMTQTDAAYMIDQLKKTAGLVHFKDIEGKLGFSGLVYSEGKPVNIDALQAGVEAKELASKIQANEALRKNTEALDNVLEAGAAEMGARVNTTIIEAVELGERGEVAEGKFETTLEVQKPGRKPRGRVASPALA